MKVSRVSVRFSESFARRRLRPNQAKVRSTTQRRAEEALLIGLAFDDLDAQHGDVGDGGIHLARVVADVGPDELDNSPAKLDFLLNSCQPSRSSTKFNAPGTNESDPL